MPEFFLELFSEEIPARMQLNAGISLADLCNKILGPIKFSSTRFMFGPRRVAIVGNVEDAAGSGDATEIKGPREGAADGAVEGFARKHGVSRSELFLRDGAYFLLKEKKSATEIIQTELGPALSKFEWQKSMHWGQSDNFTWVRPLRRIVCLLDEQVIPITVGPITASNLTEGHRFAASGEFEDYETGKAFSVLSEDDWKTKLHDHKVIADQGTRKQDILNKLKSLAGVKGLTLAEDQEALLDEVTGLVEWPVALIGRIDPEFMDLPPEVRELSMKINQRYFALRDTVGKPAPYFAFVANIEATDGGATIIAGNERVLRARLSDARHFWDLDLKMPLDSLLPRLDKIIFHAKIGTQRERIERIASLAQEIALMLGADYQLSQQAETAGRLCKADLVTGMVGEFPELQGIMGGYYAEKYPRGWDGAVVGPAIKTHYQPKGPSDAVPSGIVAVSVALADKLDTLIQFFRIGEKPTGSGDPYALRRAALGVIRIILENQLTLPLKPFLDGDQDLFNFIIERLRVKLRGEGQRFDILDAVLGTGADDDLVRLMQRVHAVASFLATADGTNLLAAYRRAANILRIEDAKDGPHRAATHIVHLQSPEADDLRDGLFGSSLGGTSGEPTTNAEAFALVLKYLANLRPMVDAFFDKVTVNDPDPELRRNRLQLLAKLRDTMHLIADFSKIEG